MALITQESIQAVLDACDMLEIVAPYTTLKKSGATYMGRCPFHGEKTPSFSVDPARKLFYCFGCGAGGNAFGFVQEKEGLDFADTVKMLADKYGVRLEYEKGSPASELRQKSRDRLYKLLDQAAAYYSRVLWQSSQASFARNYLKKRGFAEDTAREFRLGFSPARGKSLIDAAKDKGYTDEELSQAGLTQDGRRGKIDRFRGRLMFPFTDHRGRVLGFGARVLDESKPKYLNSSETRLYHKSHLVFGLSNARSAIAREDRAFIVEGYTDVLALSQYGIANAVASMGTALTEQQLKEISRFTRNIYLSFDADAAGQAAMLRALELAKKMNLNVKVIRIPDGRDPADMLLSGKEKESFLELAASAPGLLEYQVQTALGSFDLGSSQGKLEAFKALGPILAGASNSIEREEQLRIVADRLRLSHENMAYLMESASSSDKGEDRDDTKRRVLSQEEITERSFLSLCLAREDEAGRYLQLMTEAHFTTDLNRSAFNWVKERLGGAHSESALDPAALPVNGELSAILPELHIRARNETFAPEALPELFLRLSKAALDRRVNALKARMDGGEEIDLKELYRLENMRRDILRKIQSGAYEIA